MRAPRYLRSAARCLLTALFLAHMERRSAHVGYIRLNDVPNSKTPTEVHADNRKRLRALYKRFRADGRMCDESLPFPPLEQVSDRILQLLISEAQRDIYDEMRVKAKVDLVNTPRLSE